MSVSIRGKSWEVRRINGPQFVRDGSGAVREVVALIDDDNAEIRLSNVGTPLFQAESAAQAAAEIATDVTPSEPAEMVFGVPVILVNAD